MRRGPSLSHPSLERCFPLCRRSHAFAAPTAAHTVDPRCTRPHRARGLSHLPGESLSSMNSVCYSDQKRNPRVDDGTITLGSVNPPFELARELAGPWFSADSAWTGTPPISKARPAPQRGLLALTKKEPGRSEILAQAPFVMLVSALFATLRPKPYSAWLRASWTAALKPLRVLEAPEAMSMSSRLSTPTTSSQ